MVVLKVEENILKKETKKIIDELPDESMDKVLTILKSIKDLIDDIDVCDLKLAEEAEKNLQDGEFVPFEKVLSEAGISEKEIRN